MLDRLAPLAHGLRVGIEPLLHRLDDVLVLPPRDPTLVARGALMLDRAGSAGVGLIAT
jgi:hypothetical protein